MDNKPYVFISYAHANSDKVLPTVSAMKDSGINLWFDEGIVAGSEWPEFIAEKVVDCHKFVLFVSNAYLNSQNCKRELNFAISRKKDILSIFLEDVQLSPGMEMQLGTYQAIYRNRFESDQALIRSLCKEPFFDPCRFAAETPRASQPTPAPQPAPQPKPTPSPYSQPAGTVTPPPVVPETHGPDWNGAINGAVDSFKDLFGGKSNGSTATAVKPAATNKNRLIAALLAFFLGSFGIQHFYMGNKWFGILSLVFCWTYIPSIIGFVQAIMLFLMTDDKFYSQCNKQTG